MLGKKHNIDLNRAFVLPFSVNIGRAEEGTFSVAFGGAVICQRDFLFEGVTLEKCLEPVVGCEYRAGCAAAENVSGGGGKEKQHLWISYTTMAYRVRS